MHLHASSTFNHHPIFISSPHSRSLNTPNKMVVSCHQATLNLNNMLSLDSRNESVEDIKKWYRKMALQYHPDVCEPSKRDECISVFLKLQDIYQTLLDKAKGGSNRVVKGEEGGCNKVWEMQVIELKRRSQSRSMRQGDQSWASKMRDQHVS